MKILNRSFLPKLLVIALTLGIILLWLQFTPPGLLGKADAIGYAICHRLSDHSFHISERALPLCARCSGTFSGVMFGILATCRMEKRAGYPTLKVLVMLGFLLLLFALDGFNSYYALSSGAILLYPPQNWLRLITGVGLGVGIGTLLLPTFRQNLWQTIDERPILSGFKDLVVTYLIALIPALGFITEIPLLTYPLAILATAAILFVFSLCFTILWVLLTNRIGAYPSWRGAWFLLVCGFSSALAFIFLMDIGRFALTGDWSGYLPF